MGMIKEILSTAAEILTCWIKDLGIYLLYMFIAILLGVLLLFVNNPFGRYADSWIGM